MSYLGPVYKSDVAKGIPFDNTGNGFTSTDVQAAIEELKAAAAASASPGFAWSRSGNIPSDSWLLNDEIPSNRAGRTILLTSATIEKISVATEDINTYSIQIYHHEGNEINLTLLHTVNVTSTRSYQTLIPSISVPTNKQLALKVGTGSAKNLVVALIIKGNL